MAVTVEKVSLSLDPELVAEARELAGRRGLSSLVNDALRIRLQHIRVARLLDEMDAEFGPVPPDVREEVAREWPDPPDRQPAG
jgi:hypothetical protein